jgi:Alpha-kinase family
MQGCWNSNSYTLRKQFTLCDPVVHSPSVLTECATNLGRPGMDLFFQSHKCTALCRQLALPRHKLQPNADKATCDLSVAVSSLRLS